MYKLVAKSLFTVLFSVSLGCGPAIAEIQDPQQYDADLQGVIDELRQSQQSPILNPIGLGGSTKAFKLKSELEAMTNNGDYDAFMNALKERELMVMKNPSMGMLIYIHPYQNKDSGFAIGKSILDGDQTALEAALEGMDGDLESSLYVDLYLGYTPLVMAVQQKNHQMVETLLSAGANPNAKSANMSVTPMEVAKLLKHEKIIEALVAAGAK